MTSFFPEIKNYLYHTANVSGKKVMFGLIKKKKKGIRVLVRSKNINLFKFFYLVLLLVFNNDVKADNSTRACHVIDRTIHLDSRGP